MKVANEVRHALEIRKSAKRIAPDVVMDPAWEILLGLYASMSTGPGLRLEDLSEQTGLSFPLCLRWTKILWGRGYLKSPQNDPLPADKASLTLSHKGIDLVERSFQVKLSA